MIEYTPRQSNAIAYDENLASRYNHLHENTYELSIMVKHVKVARRSLDLGCGAGRLLIPLQRLGYDVYGIEGSKAMHDQCKRYHAMNVLLYKVDMQKKDELRDKILMMDVDLIYASFSLHQICNTIDEQLDLLKMLTSISPVLVITTLPDYFYMNPTTMFSAKATDLDRLRFPERSFYYDNFKVMSSVDLIVDTPVTHDAYIEGIVHRHISTFQMLSDTELASIATESAKAKYLPQIHSYLLLV